MSELHATELLPLAQAWLAERHPDAVIVTELSVSDWGGASVDIAAITDKHIVGIEIKGKGDSPARLDRQGVSYPMVVREMWLLPCPSIADKCLKHKPSGWGRLEVWEGAVRAYNCATKPGEKVARPGGGYYLKNFRDHSKYRPDTARIGGHLTPAAICGTLWRDELYDIARVFRVEGVATRSPVGVITEALIDQVPVTALHDEMIRQLRQRKWKKQVLDLRAPAGRVGMLI